MKSFITEKKPKEYYWPKLMRLHGTDVIVLFVSEENGTVVHEDKGFFIGQRSNQWEMKCFEDFHGRVVLEG